MKQPIISAVQPNENNLSTVVSEGLSVTSNLQSTPEIHTTTQPAPEVNSINALTPEIVTHIDKVPQIETQMTSSQVPVSTIINAPFVQVTSVNGRTGDVQVDSVIDTFTPHKFYRRGQAIIDNGSIYVAKEDFTASNSISLKDWHRALAKESRNTPLIVGTQTSTTGNWTGDAPFPSLEDGQEIIYWLPQVTTGSATLRLILSNSTETEAIPVYRMGSSRVTTHYTKGSIIRLVYLENPSGAQTGWFANADYDSNTYWQLRHSNAIHLKKNVVSRQIIVGDSAGYEVAASGVDFDITYPILNIAENRPANTDSTYTYVALDGTDLRVTKSGYSGNVRAMAYLVCTIDGTRATITEEVITSNIPQQENGKAYIPIGVHYSNTHIYFRTSRDIYYYKHGKVQLYGVDGQSLSLSGNQLSITGGNSVTLPLPEKATQSKDGLMPKEDKAKVDNLTSLLNTLRVEIETSILNKLHPIGSIYITTKNVNPGTHLGGVWQAWGQGRVIVGVGSNGTTNYTNAEQTGGSDKVQLTTETTPNTHIGFLAVPVPGGHGRWNNRGVVAGSSPAKDNLYYGPTTSAGSTQWGWNLYTNGGDQPHENRPSFITAYQWKRVS